MINKLKLIKNIKVKLKYKFLLLFFLPIWMFLILRLTFLVLYNGWMYLNCNNLKWINMETSQIYKTMLLKASWRYRFLLFIFFLTSKDL